MTCAVISIVAFLLLLFSGRRRSGSGCLNLLLFNSLINSGGSGWSSSGWSSGPFGDTGWGSGGDFGGSFGGDDFGGGFGGGGDFDGGGAGGSW